MKNLKIELSDEFYDRLLDFLATLPQSEWRIVPGLFGEREGLTRPQNSICPELVEGLSKMNIDIPSPRDEFYTDLL